MNLSDPIPTLTVTGHGRTRVAPDLTVFTVELETLEATVAEAQGALTASRKRLADALLRARVDETKVRSSGPHLAPRHTYENSRWIYRGIGGEERFVIRLPHETGHATEVLHALGDELISLQVRIHHAIEDPRPARAEALRMAVVDACAQAEIIAEAAGLRLSGICKMSLGSETGNSPGELRLGSAAEQSAFGETEFDPAEILVEAEVTIVWNLSAEESGAAISKRVP